MSARTAAPKTRPADRDQSGDLCETRTFVMTRMVRSGRSEKGAAKARRGRHDGDGALSPPSWAYEEPRRRACHGGSHRGAKPLAPTAVAVSTSPSGRGSFER